MTDKQPAFPSHGSMGEIVQEGMTLRDYFAAKAMHGDMTQGIHEADFRETAARAYAMADVMMEARK